MTNERELYRDGFELLVKYVTCLKHIVFNAIKLERVKKLRFATLQRALDVEQRVYENYRSSNQIYNESLAFLRRVESRGSKISARKRNLNKTMREYQRIHSDITYLLANLIKEKQEKEARAKGVQK